MRKLLFSLLTLLSFAIPAYSQQGEKSFTFTIAGPDNAINLVNTSIAWHKLTWSVNGTVSACTVALDSSTDGNTWTAGGVITGQTCTSNGSSSVVNVTANYVRMNMTALTVSGGGSVTVTWDGWISNPAEGGGGSITSCTTTGGILYQNGTANTGTCSSGLNYVSNILNLGSPLTSFDAFLQSTYFPVGPTNAFNGIIAANSGNPAPNAQEFVSQGDGAQALYLVAGVPTGTPTSGTVGITSFGFMRATGNTAFSGLGGYFEGDQYTGTGVQSGGAAGVQCASRNAGQGTILAPATAGYPGLFGCVSVGNINDATAAGAVPVDAGLGCTVNMRSSLLLGGGSDALVNACLYAVDQGSASSSYFLYSLGGKNLLGPTTYNGHICFNGTTSGIACIYVPAIAGTPADLDLPTTTGAAGQILSTNGANPQLLSWINPVFLTVATDGTGNYNATGTNDQIPIQNAINAANSAGGGTVYIKHGVYHLGACVTPKNNVRVIGDRPGLTGFDGQSNDYWTFDGTGTVLQNDVAGTSSAFCFNTSPSSNPALYATSNSLSHATFEDLGFFQFTRAFDIGSQNNPGLYWGVLRNIYISSSTQWGVHFENFSESWFDNIHSVSNTTGDQWYASTVNQANYEPGNSQFHQIYSSPLNNLARGVVFAAPGAESNNQSGLNSIKVTNLQVNRFRDTLTTQTITPQNTTTNINVTDLTKFTPGMPFWVTTTADGLTANLMYFVLTQSGSSGSGTITAGTSATATAITYTASTALTMNSYGFANVELAGNLGTVTKSSVNAIILGLDVEGNASMGVYDEDSVDATYQITVSALHNGPSAVVTRSANSPVFINNGQLVTDIDGNSGTQPTWVGSIGTALQKTPRGVIYGSTLAAWGISFSGFGLDVYERTPTGGLFLYPSSGMGEGIYTRDTTQTLNPNECGVLTFNGAASQTFTLPAIDNAATKNASLQGCHIKIVNASQTNSLAITTTSSQTFNNIPSLTSLTEPPNSILEVTASTTSTGSILYWATIGQGVSGLAPTNNSAIHQTAQTGAISIATLCAGSAGSSCGVAGEYEVSYTFIQGGTACSVPGTGGVTFLLTWTDTNGNAHSAVSLPMDDASAITSLSQTFHFQTTNAAAWASGVFNISTNGSVIQYATGYTACGTGTGTYQLDAVVTRKQ